MAKFFNYFPKTIYSFDDKTTSFDLTTHIITRLNFQEKLKKNSTSFYDYNIQDSDTPEIIASKYYDNPERHWIVLLFNNIIDPQFDWPLKQYDLMNFINEKYSSNAANTIYVSGVDWAKSQNNPHSYYKTITTTTFEKTTIEKFQVDANTYANNIIMQNGVNQNYILQDKSTVNIKINKEIKTHYDYEVEENDKKRTIKLLKSDFVLDVEKEFKKVLKV